MSMLRNISSKSLGLAFAALLSGLTAAKGSVINVTVDTSGVLYNGVGVADKDEYGYNDNTAASNLGFLNTEIGNYNAFNNPDLPSGVGPVGASYDNLGGVNSYTTVGGYDYVVLHYGTGQAEFADAPVWVPEVVVPPVYYTAAEVAAWNALPQHRHNQISTSTIKTPGYTIPAHYTQTNWQKSAGGWWAAFYIDGLAGINFNLPVPGPTYDGLIYNGLPVGGFSSARYFNTHHEPPPEFVPDSGTSAILFGLGLLSLAFFRRKLA
jgi:hypothetical protein